MGIVKYFPEGIALGDAFINRNDERKTLISRIKSTKHTVLMAPRRYGKTSLVIKVANEMNIPYCSMDFLAAYSEGYVRDQILDKVGHLVLELLPKVKKAKDKVISIFKQMKPEISIGAFGQKLKLDLSNRPLNDITDTLLKLDETARHFKKRAAIFFDEFQQISKLKNYHSIEASIRHAVERSTNISYVFSGSNRRLLSQMFGDQGRPLYRLCQIITIERIDKQHYVRRLQKLAKLKWKKELCADVIEQIFYQTEMHPYYINILCQLLWEYDYIATIDVVDSTWCNYVKTQRQLISSDTMELSINQRKVISVLAKTPSKEIQSADFISPLKISASSAQQAADVLIRKDLVYQNSEGLYCVLDPAMRFYLDVVLWK